MKETTTEQVPATTRKVHTIVCDVCGARMLGIRWPDSRPGKTGLYTGTEVKVEFRHVEDYPGDGSARGDAWDFCPTCFDQKVRPLLETIAKARKVEESW